MVTVTQVQILDKAVSISHGTNTLGKGMNLTIVLPLMDKIVGQTDSIILVWQPVYDKENTEFKSVKLGF